MKTYNELLGYFSIYINSELLIDMAILSTREYSIIGANENKSRGKNMLTGIMAILFQLFN